MQRPTQAFRDEHQDLLEHVERIRIAARELPWISWAERREVVDRVLRFLNETLIPHAEAEERGLYPEWSRLVGYPDAAAPMIQDHRAIRARAARLADAELSNTEAMQELMYGLYALILVHFEKEEEIQLRALDEQPPEAVERILERMAAGGEPVAVSVAAPGPQPEPRAS